jgi:putative MATE family efflux protein
MGGHALFNLADLWIVGGLGPAAIAAITISSLVNSLPMVLMQGVTDGSVALISRAVGAGDMKRAGDATHRSIVLTLLLGVLLGVPPWFAARHLVAAFGVTGDAAALGTECLRIMSLGSVTMFLLMQACAALRAAGHGAVPAVLLLGANSLNLFLSVGLVYGKFGLPEAGVVGAAWGTVASRGVFAIAGVVLLARSSLRLKWRGPGPGSGFVRSILSLGLPVAAQWTVRLAPVLVVLGVAGSVGTDASAAYGIGSRLDQLALFACAGWGAAAATAVGQGLGARDPEGAARAAWRAVLFGVVTMVAAGATFAIFAHPLVALVGREGTATTEVLALGTGYVRTIVAAYPAIGIAIVLAMGLSGGGSVKLALGVEAGILLGLQVPLVLYLAPDGHGGSLHRVWLAVVATYWLLAAAYVAVFLRGHWKQKHVE